MTTSTRNWVDVWIGLVIVGTLLALLGPCAANPAYAHGDTIVKCDRNLKVDSVVKIDEKTLQNGLLDEHYDRNDDGLVDIHAYSAITGTMDENNLVPHRAFPIFWHVDLDFDGRVDKIFIDIHGEGRCGDIKLYLDMNAPLPDSMFNSPGEPTDPEIIEDEIILTPGGEL